MSVKGHERTSKPFGLHVRSALILEVGYRRWTRLMGMRAGELSKVERRSFFA
jgi:hypothetical protein